MSKLVVGEIMKTKINKATKDDYQIVYELTKQVFADYNKHLPSVFLQSPALKETKADVIEDITAKNVLIAYYDNEPVGSVRYSLLEDGDYLLSRLGVLAPYRGLKIGSNLVEAVEKEVATKGGSGVLLYSAYSAKRVLDFYKKLGYDLIDVEKQPDYKRAVLYKKL